MSRHKITAYRSGSHPTMGDWDAEYTITFNYTPGSKPTLVDPGSGPTVEFVKIEPDPDAPTAFLDIARKWQAEWGEDWLAEHEDEAIASARDDLDAAADDYADFKRRQRIDDKLTGDR